MLIGAHVSIAGGFDNCINRGEALGATAIQTFASSPRSFQTNPLSAETVALYKEKRSATNIAYHVFHGVYLINLAHPDDRLRQVAINSLKFYQETAGQIGGAGTIFHVGSHKGSGFDSVVDRVAKAVVEVLAETPDGVQLMLENAAGHKGTIGQTFDELAMIFEAVNKLGADMNKLAVGLDTQHAFASGYDLRIEEGLEKMLTEFNKSVGLANLVMVHANDSQTEFASHHDRHENIGQGHIGTEAFRRIVNHPQLKHLPFILEVPGEKKSGPRKEDVQALQALVS